MLIIYYVPLYIHSIYNVNWKILGHKTLVNCKWQAKLRLAKKNNNYRFKPSPELFQMLQQLADNTFASLIKLSPAKIFHCTV